MITLKSIPLRVEPHPRPALADRPRRPRRRPVLIQRAAVHRAARQRRAMGRRNLAAARRLGHAAGTPAGRP